MNKKKSSTEAFQAPQNAVTIKRDTYGVPHIYAQTKYGLFYGYGFALAQDRLFSMEIAKRSTQGRLAEIFGHKLIEFDKGIRQNFNPASIRRQLAELSSEDYDIFSGYAAGMNTFIEKTQENPSKYLPKQFREFQFYPEPWNEYDIAMIFVGSMINRYGDFNTELENAVILRRLIKRLGKTKAFSAFNQLIPLSVPGSPSTIDEEEWSASSEIPKEASHQLVYQSYPGYVRPLNTDADAGAKPRKADSPFSMIMVLGKEKSENINSMLLNGPQFGWFSPSYLYSVGLHGAGFNLVGNTPFGYPAVLFGHNNDIAWGSTWGGGDLIDIYTEKLHRKDLGSYLFEGEYRKFEKRLEVIQVKNRLEYRFHVYRSVHGPIVQFKPKLGLAYAKKRSWDGQEIHSLLEWIRSTQAKDYESWIKHSHEQAINVNMFYSDKHGNIGYFFGGKYPKRQPSHDNRLPVFGAAHEWIGPPSSSDNPRVYNPQKGYLVNWNNQPALGVLNPDVFWFSWTKADRFLFLQNAMESQDAFSADELWDLMQESAFVDPIVQYFIPHLKKALSYTEDKDLHALGKAIFQWNGLRLDSDEDGYYDSHGIAVFQIFVAALVDYVLKDDLGNSVYSFFSATGYATPEHPYNSSINLPVSVKAIIERLEAEPFNKDENGYDFFNGEQSEVVLLKALAKTWRYGKRKYGSNLENWRLETVPLVFRTKNFLGIPQNSKNEEKTLPVAMNRGSGNIFVIFHPDGEVEGYEVVPPGQSGFIQQNGQKSKHYANQLGLYKNFQKKRMWLHKADVDAHTERITTLFYALQPSQTK